MASNRKEKERRKGEITQQGKSAKVCTGRTHKDTTRQWTQSHSSDLGARGGGRSVERLQRGNGGLVFGELPPPGGPVKGARAANQQAVDVLVDGAVGGAQHRVEDKVGRGKGVHQGDGVRLQLGTELENGGAHQAVGRRSGVVAALVERRGVGVQRPEAVEEGHPAEDGGNGRRQVR